MAESGGRLNKEIRKLLQCFGAVGGAAGVVGAVDEDGGGVLVHQRRKGGKVDLEIRAAGQCDAQRQARALNIGLIFGEERRKGHDVLPGHGHAAQGMGQRAGRTARHKDVVGGVVHAEALVQALGHGLAGGGQRQGRCVAVQRDGVGALQQILARGGELRRAGHRGIAQRVVKYIFIADLCAARGAPLRNLPNDRLGTQHIFIVLCNHNNSSFAKCLSRCGRGERQSPGRSYFLL